MAKVISFEKFSILAEAGVRDSTAAETHHTVQMHSASESFVQAVAHRSGHKSSPRGY